MAISPSHHLVSSGTSIETLVAVEGHRWADRGKLRDAKNRVGLDQQREQIMAWLASPRFPGDARLRHDGRDPTSRQSAAAQKNENVVPRQKPRHSRADIDPFGQFRKSAGIAIQTRAKPYPTRTYRRMVTPGAELTKLPLSERTFKSINGNCNARAFSSEAMPARHLMQGRMPFA